MRTASFTSEAFAADRLTVLDKAEEYLAAAVTAAVKHWGDAHWSLGLVQRAEDLFDRAYREEAGQRPTNDAVHRREHYLSELERALEHTSEPGKFTAATLARFVATGTVNVATEAAAIDDEAELVLEWVSMHDDDVRHAHRLLNGEQRRIGEPFHVEGEEIRFPGDTTAPLELWINCRCVLRADAPSEHQALVAAASEKKPTVIVALPHPDDPVHKMGPEPSHVTLLYLGDGEGLDTDAINQAVAEVAQQCAPFADPVNGQAVLGPDEANVLLMDADHLVGVRSELLAKDNIYEAHEDANQHPTWIPHLTVGYGADGAMGESGPPVDKPEQISFDRLALWHGDGQTEHPMGKGVAVEPDEAAALVAAAGAAIPWHGVLTTEGHKSGDRRSFKPGSLRNRNLPLPLTWQKVADEGHKGGVKIARMDNIARVPIGEGKNEIRSHGYLMPGDENADKVIGEMAFYGRIGVSVDIDDATFEITQAAEGEHPVTEFTDARIASACAVIIPAFQEAWLQLGEPPEGFMDGGTPTTEPEATAAAETDSFVSEGSWDGSASRFTPEQWKSSCILHLGDGLEKVNHKLPIHEPGGELSRAGVHAAAARINQVDAPSSAVSSAKSALRGAYKQLGEQPPFGLDDIELSAELAELARGPGWITNPEDTKRLHDYWTVAGQPGYEKIAWGTPGDYERCVNEIGKERAEQDPAATARFINAQCAQWQHDAIGVWPGPHEKLAAETESGQAAPTLSLVASVQSTKWPVPKFDRFKKPELAGITPINFVEEDGRTYVYGHMADRKECHLDFTGVCVTPPPLYDYGIRFMCGATETDQGRIATGCLTLGGGHADTALGWLAAKEHYDDVTTAVADVCVGEDEHGYWFAGVLRPWVTDEQRYQLYGAKLSGDWREVGGQLTLIAAHAVNTPGFLVAQTRVHDEHQMALVAAGGVGRDELPTQTSDAQTVTIKATDGTTFELTGFETLRPGPPVDLTQVAVEAIRTYKESEAASATIKEVAEAAQVTPAARLAKVREQIGD